MSEDKAVQHGYSEIRFRAQHGGLVMDKVRLGTKLVELRVRDARHAALQSILDEAGLADTANELEFAAYSLDNGRGNLVMDVNKIRGGNTGTSDWVAILQTDYMAWDSKCKENHHSPKMCRAVIVEGHSLNSQDKAYHFKEGTARKNMISCLTIFAQMRKP